mmetsp:Transcript_98616/g.144386  ORF Transcript_98616/g.144386 Transcript_98616/m.144386 type:complete len:210 (+) Transcript_98616:2892-3521(+)
MGGAEEIGRSKTDDSSGISNKRVRNNRPCFNARIVALQHTADQVLYFRVEGCHIRRALTIMCITLSGTRLQAPPTELVPTFFARHVIAALILCDIPTAPCRTRLGRTANKLRRGQLLDSFYRCLVRASLNLSQRLDFGCAPQLHEHLNHLRECRHTFRQLFDAISALLRGFRANLRIFVLVASPWSHTPTTPARASIGSSVLALQILHS